MRRSFAVASYAFVENNRKDEDDNKSSGSTKKEKDR